MAAPMLLAGTIKTISNMRDGFESINIVSSVPRQLEFGNAAAQMSIEIDNVYNNYDCRKCGRLGATVFFYQLMFD